MKQNKSSMKNCLSIIAVMLTGYIISINGSELKSDSGSDNNENSSVKSSVKEDVNKNWALRFNGVDNVVNCGDIDKLDSVSALTIEMWVNIEKFSPWKTFFAKRVDDFNRIQFQQYSEPGDIGIAVSSGKILGYYHTVNKPVTIGDWFHLAMVFDGSSIKDSGKLKIYINGREAAIAPHKGDAVAECTPVNNAPVLLGAERKNGAYGYAGTMDEVRIWNSARTQAQVIEDLRSTEVKDTSGLVVCYDFNEGTGTELVDKMGNRNGILKRNISGETSNWILRGYVKPSVAAAAVIPEEVSAEKIKIGWRCGSGTYRTVFMKKGNDSISAPGDLITYEAALFGSGSQIGSSGWYCVYNGTGCSTEITGLSIATEYTIHVVEYNGVHGKEQYLTNAAQGNPVNIKTASVEKQPLVQIENIHVDVVEKPLVKPQIAVQSPVEKNINLNKKRKAMFIFASGFSGAVVAGVVSAIALNTHSSNSSGSGHDLGIPPVDP